MCVLLFSIESSLIQHLYHHHYHHYSHYQLELELVQPHMAQKPVLRCEVGCACVAREVSVDHHHHHHYHYHHHCHHNS